MLVVHLFVSYIHVNLSHFFSSSWCRGLAAASACGCSWTFLFTLLSTKIYDKRDDFDFDIVNFPFLDGDVPRRTSYRVYISQLIRFARASSSISDFNCRNNALTAKLLRQGYHFINFAKHFQSFIVVTVGW